MPNTENRKNSNKKPTLQEHSQTVIIPQLTPEMLEQARRAAEQGKTAEQIEQAKDIGVVHLAHLIRRQQVLVVDQSGRVAEQMAQGDGLRRHRQRGQPAAHRIVERQHAADTTAPPGPLSPRSVASLIGSTTVGTLGA